jgi:hypothetical protein
MPLTAIVLQSKLVYCSATFLHELQHGSSCMIVKALEGVIVRPLSFPLMKIFHYQVDSHLAPSNSTTAT